MKFAIKYENIAILKGRRIMINRNIKLTSDMDIEDSSTNYTYMPSQRTERYPFYCEGAGHFHANMGYFTEREGLESYLLILTINGCGYIKTKNNEVLVARNRAVLIDCMEYQYYRTASDSVWEFVWIHLNGFAMSFYYNLLNGNGLELIDFENDLTPLSQVNSIFESMDSKDSNLDLIISEKIMSLITRMTLSKKTISASSDYAQHRKDINMAIDIIKSRFSENINIEELSKHAHISKFYFVRIFKEITGKTPYDYLISYRINEAKKYLLKSDIPISEIAIRCGFLDTSNFIRYFKKASKVTPGVFRRERSFFN